MFAPFQFPLVPSRAVLAALAILSSIVLAGCKKEAEITRYQVPKEKPPAAAPPSAGTGESSKAKTRGQDRMLTAIIPRGDDAWFFKMAGSGELIGKHEKSFNEVVQSVTFPESADGEPEWKAPEDWQRQPGDQFRFATLLIPSEGGGKPLELAISKLPWKSSAEDEAILINVNRWRTQQMQLPPLTKDDLKDETRRVKLADGEAIFVDLKGTYQQGMRPQFANPPGGTEK